MRLVLFLHRLQTQACEDDPARAEAANVMATAHLAHALAAAEAARTAAHGNSNSQPNSDPNSDPKADPSLTTTPVHSRPAPLMVLVSTDWAYAASAQVGVPLREDAAEATGFGVYGRSKVAAEAQLRAALPTAHVVLRSALIYGRPAPHAPTRLRSCLGWMVDALLACKPLALFEDEFRTPVLVDDVVAALTACLTLSRTAGAAGLNVHDELARRSASGPGPVAAVFNIAGATRVSRLEMGRLLAAALQVDGELNGACGLTAVRGCSVSIGRRYGTGDKRGPKEIASPDTKPRQTDTCSLERPRGMEECMPALTERPLSKTTHIQRCLH